MTDQCTICCALHGRHGDISDTFPPSPRSRQTPFWAVSPHRHHRKAPSSAPPGSAEQCCALGCVVWSLKPLLHGEPQSLRAGPCPAVGAFQHHLPAPCETPTNPLMHSRAASATPAAPSPAPCTHPPAEGPWWFSLPPHQHRHYPCACPLAQSPATPRTAHGHPPPDPSAPPRQVPQSLYHLSPKSHREGPGPLLTHVRSLCNPRGTQTLLSPPHASATPKRRPPRKRDFWLCKLHSGSEWASA